MLKYIKPLGILNVEDYSTHVFSILALERSFVLELELVIEGKGGEMV